MSESKITKKTVAKIAKQAKLSSNPSDEFLEKYTQDLGNILGYVDELNEIDTTKIKATAIIPKITLDDLAEDKPYADQQTYARIRTNIINNFPKKQGNLLVLPIRVVE